MMRHHVSSDEEQEFLFETSSERGIDPESEDLFMSEESITPRSEKRFFPSRPLKYFLEAGDTESEGTNSMQSRYNDVQDMLSFEKENTRWKFTNPKTEIKQSLVPTPPKDYYLNSRSKWAAEHHRLPERRNTDSGLSTSPRTSSYLVSGSLDSHFSIYDVVPTPPQRARVSPHEEEKKSNQDEEYLTESLIDDIRLGGLIGNGAYAQVFLGMNMSTGVRYAVKQLKSDTVDEFKSHQTELSLLKGLTHPNIIKYYGFRIIGTSCIEIVMEFASGGTLSQSLKQFGPFSLQLISKFTYDMLQGLHYLHSKQIIHRDIKGANVLLSSKGVAMLADFGTSRYLPSMSDGTMCSMRGSVPWMSPEVVCQCRYGLPADIWSLGATVLEMSSGMRPWSEISEQCALIFKIGTAMKPPSMPKETDPQVRSFLAKCLCTEPCDRWTTEELLSHRLISRYRMSNHIDQII